MRGPSKNKKAFTTQDDPYKSDPDHRAGEFLWLVDLNELASLNHQGKGKEKVALCHS
jgi:hypothetical protein